MKKIISCAICFILIFNCVSSQIVWAETDDAKVIVGTSESNQSETVEIPIMITGNPGIASFRFIIEYDSAILKLTNVTFKDVAEDFFTGTSQNYESPYSLSGFNANENIYKNGEIAVLTFEVNKNSEPGFYPITLTYDQEDVFSLNGDTVELNIQNGGVRIGAYVPGDVNDDTLVDLSDVVTLAQYVAKWDIECNEAALNVNGDNTVDLSDVVHLAQYVARWEGVTLQ